MMEQSFANEYAGVLTWFARDLISVKTGKKFAQRLRRAGELYSGRRFRDITEVVENVYKFSNYLRQYGSSGTDNDY